MSARQRPGAITTFDVVMTSWSEEQFMAWLKNTALAFGWRYYHARNSLGSDRGWPDVTLCRERMVFAELKSQRGKVSVEQTAWLAALRGAGQEAYLWRPSDWREIETVLGVRR